MYKGVRPLEVTYSQARQSLKSWMVRRRLLESLMETAAMPNQAGEDLASFDLDRLEARTIRIPGSWQP